MGDTKATAANGTEQPHVKEARRLAMQLRRRVWNGSTWEPEDKSVRILAAALAARAREAKATGFIAGWLAANPNETLAEGRAKYIESLERAVGEKAGQ